MTRSGDPAAGAHLRAEAFQRCYYELDRLRIRRDLLGWFGFALCGGRKWRRQYLKIADLEQIERALQGCRTPREAAQLLPEPHRQWVLEEQEKRNYA